MDNGSGSSPHSSSQRSSLEWQYNQSTDLFKRYTESKSDNSRSNETTNSKQPPPPSKQPLIVRINELVRDLENFLISSAHVISPGLIDQIYMLLNQAQQMRFDETDPCNLDLEAALVHLKGVITESLKPKANADFPISSIRLPSYESKHFDKREKKSINHSEEPHSFSHRR